MVVVGLVAVDLGEELSAPSKRYFVWYYPLLGMLFPTCVVDTNVY